MLRRLSTKLHLYLGLLAGALLVPIGLTGSVLVFHDEIDAALHPGLLRVEPRERGWGPVEAAARAVLEAFPRQHPERLDLARGPGEVHEFVLQGDGRSVYVDPYTGRILGSRLPREHLTGLLFEVHVNLLGGRRGETLVGILGLCLVVLGGTGLVLWWRGRRQVLRGLSVRWSGSWRRTNFDLHRAGGFYALLPLLALALTGSGLIFYTPLQQTTHALTGTPMPPPPPSSLPREGAPSAPTLDAVLAHAQAALPSARANRIDFPVGPEGSYRVRLRLPSDVHPVGMSMVYIDRYSGAVLRTDSAPEAAPAARLGHWLYPIHIGDLGGLWLRLLWAAAGLMPTLLFVTGFLIWRRPRRRARRASAGAVPAEPNLR